MPDIDRDGESIYKISYKEMEKDPEGFYRGAFSTFLKTITGAQIIANCGTLAKIVDMANLGTLGARTLTDVLYKRVLLITRAGGVGAGIPKHCPPAVAELAGYRIEADTEAKTPADKVDRTLTIGGYLSGACTPENVCAAFEATQNLQAVLGLEDRAMELQKTRYELMAVIEARDSKLGVGTVDIGRAMKRARKVLFVGDEAALTESGAVDALLALYNETCTKIHSKLDEFENRIDSLSAISLGYESFVDAMHIDALYQMVGILHENGGIMFQAPSIIKSHFTWEMPMLVDTEKTELVDAEKAKLVQRLLSLEVRSIANVISNNHGKDMDDVNLRHGVITGSGLVVSAGQDSQLDLDEADGPPQGIAVGAGQSSQLETDHASGPPKSSAECESEDIDFEQYRARIERLANQKQSPEELAQLEFIDSFVADLRVRCKGNAYACSDDTDDDLQPSGQMTGANLMESDNMTLYQ
jgi:hypothetical protein